MHIVVVQRICKKREKRQGRIAFVWGGVQSTRAPGVVQNERDLKELRKSSLLCTLLARVNKDGTIIFLNAQLEKLFGYQRSKLLHRKVELLLPERLRDVHARHRADFNANPRLRPMGAIGHALLGRRKCGQEFPVEISLSPIVTSHSLHFISTAMRCQRTKRDGRAYRCVRASQIDLM